MFYFHSYLGKWSNLTNIFQMGWNHQLVNHVFFWISTNGSLVVKLGEPLNLPECRVKDFAKTSDFPNAGRTRTNRPLTWIKTQPLVDQPVSNIPPTSRNKALWSGPYLPLAYFNKALSNHRFFCGGYVRGGWFSHKAIGSFWWHQTEQISCCEWFFTFSCGKRCCCFQPWLQKRSSCLLAEMFLKKTTSHDISGLWEDEG